MLEVDATEAQTFILHGNQGDDRRSSPEGKHSIDISGQQDNRVVDAIVFADGSQYNGTLRMGVPDGLGTCVWKDGNQYDGEWRHGVMHGFGTYLWTSGQRYDGQWKDGKREGVGVKKYADGATFEGFWRDGKKHGIGVFRPAHREADKRASKSSVVLTPITVGKELRSCATESIQAVESSELSTMDRKVIYIRAFTEGHMVRENRLNKDEVKAIFGAVAAPARKPLRQKLKSALGIGKRLQQKQGQILFKGTPGYELMIKLQLGVRYSVGRVGQPTLKLLAGQGQPAVLFQAESAPEPFKMMLPESFTEKSKIFFPSSGSTTTPAHPSSDFKWKDYCPKVFRSLRAMNGIHDAEYMLSLGGSQALWQLNSPGKSGCMFFLSDDEKFLVKTMRKSEISVLLEMLPLYYSHMAENHDSLVTRFFGVHGVKQVHGRTVRFVVMANLFNTELQIHRKFDLKGSTEGRTAGVVDVSDTKTVLKDLDLDIRLLIEPSAHAHIVSTLAKDALFLKQAGVMDYSLLLGVHYPHRRPKESEAPPVINHQHTSSGAVALSSPQHSTMHQHHLPHPRTSRLSPPSTANGAIEVTITNSQSRAISLSFFGNSRPNDAPVASSAASTPRLVQGADSPFKPHMEEEMANNTDGKEHDAHDPRISTPSNHSSLQSPLQPQASLHHGFVRPDCTSFSSPREEEVPADRARNFDLFSDKLETDRRLKEVEARMRDLAYSEQRIADVLGLAKLKILGERIQSKGANDASGARQGATPRSVLKVMLSMRHNQWGEDLRLEEQEEVGPGGGSDDEGLLENQMLEGVHSTQGPSTHSAPGLHVPGIAVSKVDGSTEEVIVCFGIIDILQGFTLRKTIERGWKSMLHDGYAISVAPPQLYARRFLDFMTTHLFDKLPAGLRTQPHSRPRTPEHGVRHSTAV